MKLGHLAQAIVVVSAIAVTGCSGLAQQMKATSQGLKVSYEVRKEEFGGFRGPLQIQVVDTRSDKEIVGPGAKPTIGQHVLGYLLLSVAYAPAHALTGQGPHVTEESELPETIRRAFAERFSTNGLRVAHAGDAAPVLLEIELTKFFLDFSFGTWTAEAGYLAKLIENGAEVCRQSLEEKRTRFNVWGYASGEAALSDVFNAAVNAFTPTACTRKST